MIDEWQDNITPFSKATERANDCKKLREKIRNQTTGIKVDKLSSTYFSKQRFELLSWII